MKIIINQHKSILYAITGSVVLLFMVFPVQASELEEIIVTAQRRAESLQDTPISVTAFTSADLQNKGISDIAEIADFTPNMMFDTTAIISGSSSAAVIFIRGIGQSNFQVTNDPGVGTYVDGVYVSSAIGGVMDVIDVENIEVLRGPQGTLFGRNTIGGAINITTQKPSAEEGGSLQFTLGNLNKIAVRGTWDQPITENLLTKWTVGYKRRDGYIKARTPLGSNANSTGLFSDSIARNQRDQGDENEGAARISALYTPRDDLTITVAADITHIREASAASTLAGVQPPAEGGLGQLTFLYNTFDAPNVDVPGLGKGILYDDRFVSDNPEDESFQTGPNGTDVDGLGLSGIIEWELSDNMTLKSITSYRETEAEFNRDPDGSPLQFTHTYNDFEHEQFSQEVQLYGNFFNGELDWITGVYYFTEDATDNLRAQLVPSFGTVNINGSAENQSIAVFGQVTWHVTDKLGLTAGVRYTQDDKELLPNFFYEADAGGLYYSEPGGTPCIGSLSEAIGAPCLFYGDEGIARTVPFELVEDKFTKITPRFGIDYRLSDDWLTYFSYSEGFKSGGFNARTTAFREAVLGFGPEALKTFEVGTKWQGFNNRVRVNMAAFYSDYSDVQVTVIDDIAPGTQNAGEIEIKGLEVEATALIGDSLLVNFGLGYLDSKYTSLAPLAETVNPVSQIRKSNSLANTPDLSTTLAVEYSIPLASSELVLRGDWSYTDEVFNDDTNSEILRAPSHHMFNASLAYTLGNYKLVLWGENLSDERFINAGDANFVIGFLEANYNLPRTYGFTVRREF